MEVWQKCFLGSLIFLFINFYTIGLGAQDQKMILEYSKKPNLIICQVITNGADKVVSELTSNQKVWFDVLKNISGGSKEWIRVAVFLREGTDVGNTSMLCEAINDALCVSPKDVLSIAVPVFHVWEVCNFGPLDTYDLTINKINNEIKILKNIKDPMLLPIAEACIKDLEIGRLPLKEYFEGTE